MFRFAIAITAAVLALSANAADVQMITARDVGMNGGRRREGSSKTPSHGCCCQE